MYLYSRTSPVAKQLKLQPATPEFHMGVSATLAFLKSQVLSEPLYLEPASPVQPPTCPFYPYSLQLHSSHHRPTSPVMFFLTFLYARKQAGIIIRVVQ